MNINSSSIFADIPEQLPSELCQTLVAKPNIRIERIVSKGHASLPEDWYDQAQDEWVMIVAGRARVAFFDGNTIDLDTGDHVFIPAHCKHRVDWTPPDRETIWLAVHIFEPKN